MSDATEIAAILIGGTVAVAGAAIVGYRLVTKCWPWDLSCQAGQLLNAGTQIIEKTVENIIKAPYEAGKAAGDFWLKNFAEQGGAFTAINAAATQSRSIAEGSTITLKYVPPTPEGNNPTNWTWQGPGGTLKCDASGKCTGAGPLQIGLPAGMSLAEFCFGSPDSPMCRDTSLQPKKISQPPTPEGYLGSNTTYMIDNGDPSQGIGPTYVGLPQGMSLNDFCAGSPDSPMCVGVATKKGLFGLGAFGL